ncbi:hypothetical protein P691DRAFT_776457 [Macrolepiota fuliginosa MF-IS2]|uniref:Uncharacterized protein n=1 Tax=Macrolepiota fuliginosa MF-IS2 TaxID=1400762 RepID=A0A9P5XCF9_9AGAR|nr:hypothetical protein P691DRAFT_776457 [Macrolepiota fuliginosa MF-IS2]
MSTSVSTFFSKDALLRRQARLNRTRKNGTMPVPSQILSPSTGSVLDIIPEEEFDSTPSVSMPISAPTTRAQRRRALNVQSTGLRTALDDITEEVITFTNISFNFPLPPLPTPALSRSPCKSPPSMSSSLPSSPDSQSAGLPSTPSSSDDEFSLPSPAFNPRRAAIKPLVINKLHRPSTLPTIDRSEESDSDDSDSEWYTREFSKILTLNSRLPPASFPAAHRDSISIAPALDSPLSPSLPERRRRRNSGLHFSVLDAPPVPPIPSQFLSPKCTKTLSITPRRPPPRMSIPDDACSAFSLSLYTDDIAEPEPSPLSAYSQESACSGGRGGIEEVSDEVEFPEDFVVQMDCPMMLPLSIPASPLDLEADIAQGLEELWTKENAAVESPKPTDELGLGVGFILEEDDEREEIQPLRVEQYVEVVAPRIICTSPPPSPLFVPAPPPITVAPVTPPRPVRSSSMSTISSFSFPPSPLSANQEFPVEDDLRDEDFDERRHGLKSKWSSSTLASVREEHAIPSPKFPGASKLKMYFQGQHKRGASSISMPLSPKFPKMPLMPLSPSPIKSKTKGKKEEKKEKDGRRRSKRESENDILIIGYNSSPFSPRPSHDSYSCYPNSPLSSPRRSHDKTPSSSPRRSNDLPHTPSPSRPGRHHAGVRRSPSQCSGVSDCGSEASSASGWSSSSGSGLRRKPIPVEMFLRGSI